VLRKTSQRHVLNERELTIRPHALSSIPPAESTVLCAT